jgi:GTP-binding protein
MLPVVALVGRPNVGKSTLFNALTRSRDALVHDQPGVTRDRHYGMVRSEQRAFLLVDTGGLSGDQEGLAALAEKQVMAAIEESTLVLFVADAREGLQPMDQEILQQLRRQGRATLLVVNKTDGLDEEVALADFARLGFDTIHPVAAAHQRGTAQLAETIFEALGERARLPAEDDIEAPPMRVAIVGRPNVGKSTLVNRLLGEDRVLASDVPGTTRDAIEVELERDGRRYTLVDTAGIRRRGRVHEVVEKFSVIKSLQAIEAANVAVVMLDAREGVTDQDLAVLGHALEAGRALVIAINKWDGLSTEQREQCRADLDRRLEFVGYARRVFISALHGSGIGDLMKAVNRAHAAAHRTFGTAELNRALRAAYESYQPPMVAGRTAKLRYAHQGGRNPPRIVVHGNRVDTLGEGYRRYLENFFRKRLKVEGTPIRFEFREGENPYEGKPNELSERQKRKRRRLMRHVRGR